MRARQSLLRSFGSLAVAIAGLGLLTLGGCAAPGPKAGPAMASPTEAADYLIGPGDSLQISVWRSPELSMSVPVRPDGRISTPLVEDIVAAGRTPAELGREIEARLKEVRLRPDRYSDCQQLCWALQPANSHRRRGCDTQRHFPIRRI